MESTAGKLAAMVGGTVSVIDEVSRRETAGWGVWVRRWDNRGSLLGSSSGGGDDDIMVPVLSVWSGVSSEDYEVQGDVHL